MRCAPRVRAEEHGKNGSAALAALLTVLAGCGADAAPGDASRDAAVDDAAVMTIDGGHDAGIDAGPPPEPRPFPPPYVAYVDPTVGTGGFTFNDIGSVHPGPQWPHGIARPGPDTTDATGAALGFTHCSGYHAVDEHVRGFSQLRMHGVGINDYGVGAFMPTTDFDDARARSESGLVTHFDKAREVARPDVYTTVLDDERLAGDITVEASARAHVAHYRVTFPATEHAALVFDLAHAHPGVTIEPSRVRFDPTSGEVELSVHFLGGYSRRFGGTTAHVVARFDRPIAAAGTFTREAGRQAATGEALREGIDGGVYVELDTRADTTVEIALGISLVDLAGARRNLDTELDGEDFDATRRELAARWEDVLDAVTLEGRSEDDARIFYTALYHSMFMPTLVSDTDGRYRGLDRAIHTLAAGEHQYSDLSLWDTYRTLHSWLSLFAPEVERDIVDSLVRMGDEYGVYPRWPLADGETEGMLGDPATIVIADGILRGTPPSDPARALAIAVRGADGSGVEGLGRVRDLADWQSIGYVPLENGNGSAARTLEYSYADHAIARIAESVGDDAIRVRFDARARHYAHVFDPASGYFVMRRRDGSFVSLEPERGADAWNEGYAEGNARQYLWLAPYDAEGLATLLGGRETALARLREFYERSVSERRGAVPPTYYFQGNEPDIHAPFLAALWGDATLAAEFSSWARRVHFSLGPRGLPGNDDSGTMSAWYLYAALGFFPIAGTDLYALGSPVFTRATVATERGTLLVEAPRAVHEGFVPTRIVIGGAPLAQPTLRHADLEGTLRFE